MVKPLILAATFAAALLMSGCASAYGHRGPAHNTDGYRHYPQHNGYYQGHLKGRPPIRSNRHYSGNRYYGNGPVVVKNPGVIIRKDYGIHRPPSYRHNRPTHRPGHRYR